MQYNNNIISIAMRFPVTYLKACIVYQIYLLLAELHNIKF